MDSDNKIIASPKKKKRAIYYTILIVLVLLIGKHVYNSFYTGPRSGVVIDADSGKPIVGAIVDVTFRKHDFFTIPTGAAFYETRTDAQGRYYVPSQSIFNRWFFLQIFISFQYDDVLIYKDGYAACVTRYYKPEVYCKNAFVEEKQKVLCN